MQKKRLTNVHPSDILSRQIADVAELADAHDSGTCEITLIGVQVPSSASKKPDKPMSGFYFFLLFNFFQKI